jgi:hypothetical protein
VRPEAWLVNLPILGLGAAAFWLDARAPDVYLRAVQEDELLEWATFWAFALAAAAFAWSTARSKSATLPWWEAGIAVFCLLVAFEEISWGQRLLGYRPPVYFLEHNYQQELNLHNVVAKDLRVLALKAVILGYGVLLPAFGAVPALRGSLASIGVRPPPLAVAPGLLAAFALYQAYPLEYSGEWVEAMLGLGFLGGALAGLPVPQGTFRRAAVLSAALAVVATAGAAQAGWSRAQKVRHPETIRAATSELEALRRDFQALRPRTPCGLHKRLHGFVDQRGVAGLREGAFSALTAQGLPEERAYYFLDPWNSPYWVRDACGDDATGRRRRTVVYSPGPNRMRESGAWARGGDDLEAVLYERPARERGTSPTTAPPGPLGGPVSR